MKQHTNLNKKGLKLVKYLDLSSLNLHFLCPSNSQSLCKGSCVPQTVLPDTHSLSPRAELFVTS